MLKITQQDEKRTQVHDKMAAQSNEVIFLAIQCEPALVMYIDTCDAGDAGRSSPLPCDRD